MNDWRTILALVLVLYVLMAYMIEVLLGSRPDDYSPELCTDRGCGTRTRLSGREFFFRYLPVILGVAGLLLLVVQLS